MSLEEPDTATAGIGPRDLDDDRARTQRVARLMSTALLMILLAAAVFVSLPDEARSGREHATSSGREVSRRGAVEEVEAATAEHTTTTSGAGAAPVPAAPVIAPPTDAQPPDSHDASTHASSPAVTPPTPVTSLPGTPVVSLGPLGPNGCTASWSVDDSGGPIVEFFVTRESDPAPAGPDGTEIGTALQVERTAEATAVVGPGWTIRVAAKNGLGTGPESEPIRCG